MIEGPAVLRSDAEVSVEKGYLESLEDLRGAVEVLLGTPSNETTEAMAEVIAAFDAIDSK